MSETDQVTDPAALIDAYYDAGWTDGLPVVLPSDASIAAMLAGAGLRGEEIIGEIHGRNAVVTAESEGASSIFRSCSGFATCTFTVDSGQRAPGLSQTLPRHTIAP